MINTVSDLLVIRNLCVKARPRKSVLIKEIYATMRPPMWTKVNNDGSSRGNPGVAGCGGIFRNYRGFSVVHLLWRHVHL